MDHQEAIETLQDIHDVAEIRIENGAGCIRANEW